MSQTPPPPPNRSAAYLLLLLCIPLGLFGGWAIGQITAWNPPVPGPSYRPPAAPQPVESATPSPSKRAQHAARTDCLTVVGWYEKAIEMCGATNAKVTETKCRARGDDVCEYLCEWQ